MMEKCQSDDFVVPSEVMEEKMNWPLDEHRCNILSHSVKGHYLNPEGDYNNHCCQCPHCLVRILQPVFLKHLEQCKERHVLEAL